MKRIQKIAFWDKQAVLAVEPLQNIGSWQPAICANFLNAKFRKAMICSLHLRTFCESAEQGSSSG